MKKLWLHIALLCVIVIGAGFGCPIYELFGLCCPLCGTTRAWICFLTGDASMAFRYHPLFLVTPFWLFTAVHYNSIFKKNRIVGIVLIGIAVILAAWNLPRMIGVVEWP